MFPVPRQHSWGARWCRRCNASEGVRRSRPPGRREEDRPRLASPVIRAGERVEGSGRRVQTAGHSVRRRWLPGHVFPAGRLRPSMHALVAQPQWPHRDLNAAATTSSAPRGASAKPRSTLTDLRSTPVVNSHLHEVTRVPSTASCRPGDIEDPRGLCSLPPRLRPVEDRRQHHEKETHVCARVRGPGGQKKPSARRSQRSIRTWGETGSEGDRAGVGCRCLCELRAAAGAAADFVQSSTARLQQRALPGLPPQRGRRPGRRTPCGPCVSPLP